MAAKKKKNKKTPFWGSPFGKIFLAAAALVLLALFFLSGPRGTIRYLKAWRQKETLQKEIEQLKTKKARLDSQRVRLKNDPEYIEKIAREQYNMKKKGETVYKIQSKTEK